MNIVKNQNGSVLIYIFIVVALFAALSYVVSQMIRGDGQSISKETSALYASEILQYSATIRNGIQDLRISNNCADDEISFENNIVEGYENTNAPTNYSCHIFHPAGAGISWTRPHEVASNSTDYHFESRRVSGSGKSLDDDLMRIHQTGLNALIDTWEVAFKKTIITVWLKGLVYCFKKHTIYVLLLTCY